MKGSKGTLSGGKRYFVGNFRGNEGEELKVKNQRMAYSVAEKSGALETY